MQNRWSLEIDQDPLLFNLEENVRYIAFFTDINHRVEPVTTGIRMTLQYNIYVGGNENELPHEENDEEKEDEKEDEVENSTRPLFEHTNRFYGVINDDLTSSLLHNLSSAVTTTNSVSLPLFHLYTSAKVVPSALKLSDRQIFDTLIDSGYCIQLQHIELRAISDSDGKYLKDDRESHYSLKPLTLFEENCERYIKN